MSFPDLRPHLHLLKATIDDALALHQRPHAFPYALGWKHRDYHDTRDLLYEVSEETLHALPSSVDLTAKCPAVYDQGNLGSCTANAIAAAFEFDVLRQNLADFMPSRLFIYYYERLLEGDVSEDNGAAIRDGIKVLNKRGVCPESEWPYDIARFADAPPVQAVTDAENDKAVKYRRIPQSLATMKGCLASGFPFVGGISVYQSFMAATNGVIPMPSPGEALEGGHAILFCGYDDASQRFIFRNSWGTSWGQQGYGTIPYTYLTSPRLAADFWQIEVVSEAVAKLAARAA